MTTNKTGAHILNYKNAPLEANGTKRKKEETISTEFYWWLFDAFMCFKQLLSCINISRWWRSFIICLSHFVVDYCKFHRNYYISRSYWLVLLDIQQSTITCVLCPWLIGNQQINSFTNKKQRTTNVQLVIHQDGEIEGGKISEIWIEAGKKEETR